MIFLLNTERVLSEVVALAKIRISGILGVRPEDIRAELEMIDGKLRTNFGVEVAEDAKPLEREVVERAVSEFWLGKAKPELIARMNGLKERRRGKEAQKA